MKLWQSVAAIAPSDLLALGAAASVLYGLALLHPAAAWIGGGVICGWVAVEVGKREAARRE